MSTSDWQTYWQIMQDGCQRILTYTQDIDPKRFQKDDKTYDAVVRNLEIISHAAASLPQDIRSRLEEKHWRTAISLSGVIADSQNREDRAGVWSVAHQQIPELLAELRANDDKDIQISRDPVQRKRGRLATHPTAIPGRGWRDIIFRVWNQIGQHNVFIVAGGVAFYGLLALFPALAALVSVYGLMFDPADVNQQLNALAGLFPLEAWSVIKEQLTRIAEGPSTTLSISALISFIITLWSARAGVGALMVAMNIVYGETEKRGIVQWYLLTLLLTLGAILFSVIALALIVALPVVLGRMGLAEQTQIWVSLLRWPLLTVSVMLGLAIIYRYGPSRRAARWTWVSWGAVGATLLWLAGSLLFSFYIANFANYNETYGSVGAVIILMLWFYVTAFIILLGAEFNAETEHQTRIDTTVGKPKPLGERGAYVADTLGERP